MFSRTTALMIGVVLFITMTFAIITVSSRDVLPGNGVERVAVILVAPFQKLVSNTSVWCTDIWNVYFSTASVALRNGELEKKLALSMAEQNICRELQLENNRLRKFMDFSRSTESTLIAAKVIGRDPSPWFKTIMINKGIRNGLSKGLPVLTSEGVVGQIIDVFDSYARVLLVTDRNSSVDALVQKSRARGIVQGNNSETCIFKYALRKDAIISGDVIVSSGLDQVFPKGLMIGVVVDVKRENSELFQSIYLKTFVDFDKLEEVLVSKVVVSPAVMDGIEASGDGVYDQIKGTQGHKVTDAGETDTIEE